MDPTQTKIYWGTPEQQQEAFLADATEAAAFGWEPLSQDQVPGSLHVTYRQRPAEPLMPVAPAPPSPPDDEPRGSSRRRGQQIWEPLVLGSFLGALTLAAWAVFIYKPPADVPTSVGELQQSIVHCASAQPSLADAIEAGLTVAGGGGIRDGYTVESPVHPGTYFVAARISGMGMAGRVGLWETDDLDGTGPIYSVNSDALGFSIWPNSDTADPRLTELDDGADVVIACADG